MAARVSLVPPVLRRRLSPQSSGTCPSAAGAATERCGLAEQLWGRGARHPPACMRPHGSSVSEDFSTHLPLGSCTSPRPHKIHKTLRSAWWKVCSSEPGSLSSPELPVAPTPLLSMQTSLSLFPTPRLTPCMSTCEPCHPSVIRCSITLSTCQDP